MKIAVEDFYAQIRTGTKVAADCDDAEAREMIFKLKNEYSIEVKHDPVFISTEGKTYQGFVFTLKENES